MNTYSHGVQDIIRDFRSTVEAFGWLKNIEQQQKSKVLECTLVTLLMYQVERRRSVGRSLIQIITEVRTLPSFNTVSERDLILTILLFQYDRDLLIRSRELISQTWAAIDIDSINRRFENGRYEPSERGDVHGVSLVLFFEYPDDFLLGLREYLSPLRKNIWETHKHHFTIFNIGTKIPVEEVNPVCGLIKDELEHELRRDFLLSNLARSLQQVAFRAEMYIIPDGSLVLFGSGEFLESMHELRLRLRERILPLDLESILARDAQPVWTYTVFARIVDCVLASQVEEMQKQHIPNAGERIKVTNARMGLMVFKDEKAMLQPEIMEIHI